MFIRIVKTMNTIIKNAKILNEGNLTIGNIWIENEFIKKIFTSFDDIKIPDNAFIIDAAGMLLMPGVIDDQVHFREPGLTYKANIYTESRAAAAGGVTSFMEMPNTNPPALTIDLLEEKYHIASENSLVNYSFYLGASNDNINEVKKVDPKKVCGVKVFMGSSTGNMLVDNETALAAIFAESPTIITTHCEDEQIIRHNNEIYKQKFAGKNIPTSCHPVIRSVEACYKSSAHAVELAAKYGTKLHILHISTAKELSLFEKSTWEHIPNITAEACVHHLWFYDADYDRLGNKIKCNPAIKYMEDREALRKAVKDGKITVVATDHAPHTLQEKEKPYFEAPSGLPLVQHSLSAMLEMHLQGVFSLNDVVNRMCHYPAKLFNVSKRGFIKEGYFADLVLVNMNEGFTPDSGNILYKCGWSPFEGVQFSTRIEKTWVNGKIVYENGEIKENKGAKRLEFNR